MAHYLLRTEERSGENVFYQHHLLEAEDAQMVKYWFHKTLKDWGWHEPMWGTNKHTLSSDDCVAEIDRITELNSLEWGVLSDYLPEWHKA